MLLELEQFVPDVEQGDDYRLLRLGTLLCPWVGTVLTPHTVAWGPEPHPTMLLGVVPAKVRPAGNYEKASNGIKIKPLTTNGLTHFSPVINGCSLAC